MAFGLVLINNRLVILKVSAVFVNVFTSFVIFFYPALIDKEFGKVQVIGFSGYAL